MSLSCASIRKEASRNHDPPAPPLPRNGGRGIFGHLAGSSKTGPPSGWGRERPLRPHSEHGPSLGASPGRGRRERPLAIYRPSSFTEQVPQREECPIVVVSVTLVDPALPHPGRAITEPPPRLRGARLASRRAAHRKHLPGVAEDHCRVSKRTCIWPAIRARSRATGMDHANSLFYCGEDFHKAPFPFLAGEDI